MKKRALAILMAALTASTMLAVPTFAADYSGEDPQLEKNIKILTIWAEDNDNGVLLNKICEDYQKNVNPNFTWEYEMVASDNLQQKIATLAASNDLPDLFAYEAGAPLSVLIDSGKVKNITEAVDEIGTADYLNSGAVELLKGLSGTDDLYDLPLGLNVEGFWYNKALFEQAGCEVPTTWDEFIDVCDTLKNKEITPIAFGNSDKWYTMWYVGQFNANFVNKDVRTADYNPSSGAFTDEGYVKAVQTFLDLNDAGYLGKNVNSKDYYQVREEFAAGKQAMILDATSQFSFYTGAMGEDGYGYFKIPIPDGATGDEASTIVTGGSENYAISAETKHPDEAVKFLKFLTKKAQAEKQTKETGLPNAIIGGITEDNSDAVIAAAYKTSEDYNAIAEWLDQCVDGNVSNTYMASLQEALDGKLAEDVMADVQKAAKEVADANK